MADIPPNDDSTATGDDVPQHERLHAVVHGYVQGVGFRASTQREAVSLNLVGWVKNTPARTVETVAEGPRAALEQFEQFLHRGPRAADVERVEITYSEATGTLSHFDIRYF